MGSREIEAGIKIGATISILGTVGITTDGQVFIEPLAIFNDRLTHITGLQADVDELVNKRNVWLVGALLGGLYLGRRAYKYVKKHNIHIPFLHEVKKE